jgi:hypothetical protein
MLLTSAIVRSTEDRDQRPIIPKFIAVFHYHVRTAYEVHVPLKAA